MRKMAFLCVAALVLLVAACADPNTGAPTDQGVHPEVWITEHSSEVADSLDFTGCTSCHGEDLGGSGGAVSCYSCHAFNTSPPFIVHPSYWDDPYSDHRAYAGLNGFDTCAGCHGPGLRGSLAAPSCFSASFDGRSCHDEGPEEVPHPLDGSYGAGDLHGPEAKQDLTACQDCHGEAGGAGDNPRFNAGITGTGCEACHGLNLAHPANWAGPNATFHYSAGNIQGACTLCHGADLDGVGGVGPSCLECHDSAVDLTLDCASCHGYPPTTAGADYDHLDLVTGYHSGGCTICHGMSESAAGGGFDPTTNFTLFDKATDTIGDHWDGNIQMSAYYNSATYGCSGVSGCHASGSDPMYDSGLPVVLKDFSE